MVTSMFSAFFTSSLLAPSGGECSLPPSREERPSSTLFLLWHHPNREARVLLTLVRMESKPPTQMLLPLGPQFLLWCLAGEEQLLSKTSVPCEVDSSLFSCLDKAGYCWVFVACVHWHFCIAGFFNSKSEIWETKRRPRELNAMVWGSLASISSALYLSELYLLYI